MPSCSILFIRFPRSNCPETFCKGLYRKMIYYQSMLNDEGNIYSNYDQMKAFCLLLSKPSKT